jgi:hypothetical protein
MTGGIVCIHTGVRGDPVPRGDGEARHG